LTHSFFTNFNDCKSPLGIFKGIVDDARVYMNKGWKLEKW